MRQFYEAYVDAGEKVSAMLRQTPHTTSAFKGTYVLEFLGLSTGRSEADLHSGLLRRLREFPVELGRDFCFVGSEFPRAGRRTGLRARPAVLPYLQALRLPCTSRRSPSSAALRDRLMTIGAL